MWRLVGQNETSIILNIANIFFRTNTTFNVLIFRYIKSYNIERRPAHFGQFETLKRISFRILAKTTN